MMPELVILVSRLKSSTCSQKIQEYEGIVSDWVNSQSNSKAEGEPKLGERLGRHTPEVIRREGLSLLFVHTEGWARYSGER